MKSPMSPEAPSYSTVPSFRYHFTVDGSSPAAGNQANYRPNKSQFRPLSPHYVQSMVALTCDLELDTDCCADTTKWAWFTQYCVAARMAKALQNRTPIPPK